MHLIPPFRLPFKELLPAAFKTPGNKSNRRGIKNIKPGTFDYAAVRIKIDHNLKQF